MQRSKLMEGTPQQPQHEEVQKLLSVLEEATRVVVSQESGEVEVEALKSRTHTSPPSMEFEGVRSGSDSKGCTGG